MTPRHVRALRGTLAAWIATLVAATAHTLAGGGPPAPALVVAVGILASPFAVALVGRRLAPARIGATVLAAQALFHAAFALTAGADPAVSHGHHATHLAGPLVGLVVPDAPMLVAHALAAALTTWALYRGEGMLRALGRGIRSVFARIRDVAPSPVAAGLAPTVTFRRGSTVRVVLSGLSRRGPPVVAAAL